MRPFLFVDPDPVVGDLADLLEITSTPSSRSGARAWPSSRWARASPRPTPSCTWPGRGRMHAQEWDPGAVVQGALGTPAMRHTRA